MTDSRRNPKPAFRSQLTVMEDNALSAVRFCLFMSRQPFRTDIEILVKLVERAYCADGESKKPKCSDQYHRKIAKSDALVCPRCGAPR